MWGTMVVAACAAMASACAEKEAGITMATMGAPSQPKRAVTGKCPCCGSRQFVLHQSRRICSYCRSEQDGQSVSYSEQIAFRQSLAAQSADMYYNRLSMLYGSSALRPELAVHITQLTEGKTDGKETVDA